MTLTSNRSFRWMFAAILLSATAAAQPAIDSVMDLASKVPPGFPFYSLAPGGFIEIHGSGLGPDQRVDDYPSFPLGQILAGSSVEVTVGETTVNALLASTSGREIKAVLPKDTPLGNGQVRVTYNGATSDPFDVFIAYSVGIFTQNGRGNGPALAINANFEPITTINPAHPGDIIMILLSTTGVEAAATPQDAPARSTMNLQQLQEKMKSGDPHSFPKAAGDLLIGTAVHFGDDMQMPPLQYGWVAPGVSSVIVQVPDVKGCWVPIYTEGNPVQGMYNSSFASLSISAPNDVVCRDPSVNYDDFLAIRQQFIADGSFKAVSDLSTLLKFDTKIEHVKEGTASGGSPSTGAPHLDFSLSAKEKELAKYVHSLGYSLGTQVFYTKPLGSKYTPSYIDLGNTVQLIQDTTVLLQKLQDGTYFHSQGFLSNLAKSQTLKYTFDGQAASSLINLIVNGIDHSPGISSINPYPIVASDGMHISITGTLPDGYRYRVEFKTCAENGYCVTISKVSTSAVIDFTPWELGHGMSTHDGQLEAIMEAIGDGTISGVPTDKIVVPEIRSRGRVTLTGIEFQNPQIWQIGAY